MPPDQLAKPLHAYPSLEPGGSVCTRFGIDAAQYNALTWISDYTVLTPAGKFLLFLDFQTGTIESDEGPAGGGIGTVGVHPSRKHYVVGQRSPDSAQLLVYEWPSRKQVGKLDGHGCQVGYAACCFDGAGTRVATVASAPDFTLAVWDWNTRTMMLRSKCFSSDVRTVRFSPFDNSRIVTSGSSHIKFWSVADTFTGPKLQGTLGKFGRLDISNVTGFASLPDGKVISGSESGCLLMWEGDLVKCSFVRHAGDEGAWVPCHDGVINVVELVHDARIVVSFGEDGWIRYWDREELDVAEGDGTPACYAPVCLLEVYVAPCFTIRSVTLRVSASQDEKEWLLLSADGVAVTSALPTLADILRHKETSPGDEPECKPLTALYFNGGAVTCCAASPVEHVAVVGGEDGVLRLVDYLTGKELTSAKWSDNSDTVRNGEQPLDRLSASLSTRTAPPVVCVEYFGTEPTHTHLVVGYGDGTVRLVATLSTREQGFRVATLGQWRPHTDRIVALVKDSAEGNVCTVSCDGTVFFFRVEASFKSLTPVGFCRLPLPQPLCAEWDEEGPGCLVGFAGGQVLAIRAPDVAGVRSEESYELSCSYALIGIRQRKLPPPRVDDDGKLEEDADDLFETADNGPWPVTVVRRLPDGTLAIGMQKEELLYNYSGAVRYPGCLELPPLPPTGVEPPNYVEDPIENLCYRDAVPQAAYLCRGGSQLLVVCDRARVLVRDSTDPQALATPSATVALMNCAHDSTRGRITGAQPSFDGSIVLTSGSDGLLVAQLRSGCSAPLPGGAPTEYAVGAGAAHASLYAEEQQAPLALSLQQQKEVDEKAREAALREQKKEAVVKGVRQLQERHTALLTVNGALAPQLRLPAEATRLDDTLEQQLKAECARRVQEARRDYVVEATRSQLQTKKLSSRFTDSVLYERVVLHSLRKGGPSVASFRTLNDEEAVARLREKIAQLDAADDSGDESGARKEDCLSPLGDRTAASEHLPWDGQPSPALSGAQQASTRAKTKLASTVQQQLEKSEERRRQRQERRMGYAALLATAPNPAEDEALLTELREKDLAQRGECVLRSDVKYHGNREFYPSASAKLRRMITVERGLNTMRIEFNEKLLAAREEKQKVVGRLNEIFARVREIDTDLGTSSTASEALVLQAEEEPEKAFETNWTVLDEFAKKKAAELQREEEAKKAQRGFGADLANTTHKQDGPRGSQQQQERWRHSTTSKSVSQTDTDVPSRRVTSGRRSDARSKGSRNVSRLAHGSRQSTTFLSAASRDRLEADVKAKLENIKPSEMEEEEKAMRQAELTSERQRLLQQAQALETRFDEELYSLSRQHARIEADLCLGVSRVLLLFREYEALLVFRNRDQKLRQHLQTTRASQEAMEADIQTLQRELTEQETAMTSLQDRLKVHKRTGETFIHDSFPADRVPFILKVFLRQIKRRRETEAGEDDDDITSDDEDDENGVYDDSDIGEEMCPSNCDADAWTNVLRLREGRLDLLDSIAEAKRAQESRTKKLGGCNSALEGILADVKSCVSHIEELNNEKRQQLNLLSTAVPLRCSQVKALDASGLIPPSLWDQKTLCVPDGELRRLGERVHELAKEKEDRRAKLEGMALDLQLLSTEKAEKHKVHAQWEAQVHEIMLLKFGRVVDLEMLESCGSSRRVETKKEELRLTELRWDRLVRRTENQIAALRNELQKALLHNTHLLQDLGDHETDRQRAEHVLAKASSRTADKFRGVQVASKADRANLRELIAAQQEEMDALNAEIFMLRRKGGHAYSPVSSQ